MKAALIIISALAVSSCSTETHEQPPLSVVSSSNSSIEQDSIKVGETLASSGSFSIPCGGGVIEGAYRSIYPVLWKVSGQPDKIVFKNEGRNSIVLERMAVCGAGVVASGADFDNNKLITYSTDCQNLMGGGTTQVTWNRKNIGSYGFISDSRGGVRIQAYDNRPSPPRFAEFYSPDCLNPLGGGKTEVVRDWHKN